MEKYLKLTNAGSVELKGLFSGNFSLIITMWFKESQLMLNVFKFEF